jgi:hypothetical protein
VLDRLGRGAQGLALAARVGRPTGTVLGVEGGAERPGMVL